MSDCRYGVSPVNYPDPDPDPEWTVLKSTCLESFEKCILKQNQLFILSRFLGWFSFM